MIELSSYLPHEQGLLVEQNRMVLKIKNQAEQTVIVEFENDEMGDMQIRLRAWGNKPQALGNFHKTSFSAALQIESPTHCDNCGTKIDAGIQCSGCQVSDA